MKKMKIAKILLAFFIFCLVFPLSGTAAIDTASGPTRIIKVGVYDNPPKVFRDSFGKAAGLYPDILNYIAQKENWRIEYVFGTWEEGLNRLKSGEIKIMVDVAVSQERSNDFDLTNKTVLNSWGVVCVSKKSTINAFPDLEGKKIAILKSSVYLTGPSSVVEYLKAFGIESEIILVDEYSQLYQLLEDGKVDAVVVGRFYALANVNNHPNIKLTDIFFSPTELKFALTKGDIDNSYLINKIDYWVEEIKSNKDGVYNRMLNNYGLESMLMTETVTPVWVFPLVVLILILVFILLLALLAFWRSKNKVVKSLRESEKRCHSLFQSMNEAVVMHEIIDDSSGNAVDYRILDCNPAYYQMMKTSKNIVVGQLATQIYKTNKPPYLSTFARVAKTGQPSSFEAYFSQIGKFLLVSIFSFSHNTFVTIARDITEKKTSELTIQNDHDRLQLYLDTIETIIVALDKEGKIISINRKGCEVLGYKERELVGKSWFSTCLPKSDDERAEYQVFKKIITGHIKQVEYFENNIITKKGRLRHVAWHNALMHDDKGNIVGTLSSGDDITLRKKAEKELLQSEDKFAKAFKTSPYALTITRVKDGKFIEVNDAFVTLSGFKRKEATANSTVSLKVWVNQLDRKKMISDLMAGRSVNSREYAFRMKDGRELIGLYSAQMIKIDDELCIISSIANINDLKLAQAKIVELMERDEAILESIGDAVFAVDISGKILTFNKIAEKITGLKSSEAIGRHYKKAINFLREIDEKPGNDFIKEAIEKNKITKMVNHTIILRKDGIKIPVADSAAPVKDAEGKIIGCVVAFRDITNEFEVNKAKTEFVSLASHQLRTPMTSLLWMSELLAGGDDGKLNKQQQEYANDIHQASKRMISLVNSILNVSRLELGSFAVTPQKSNIEKIMKDCIKELAVQINQKKIRLKEKYEGKIPLVLVDPKLFGMILSNLLTNAVKYTPAGGKVEILVEKKGKELVISIADTGVGIPKSQQDKIFSKMFRADNVKSLDPDGTGLGLYMIKEIIRQTGGQISFKSKEHKGSVFILSFPLSGMIKKEGINKLL